MMSAISELIRKSRLWIAAGFGLIAGLVLKDVLEDLVSSAIKGVMPVFAQSIPPTVRTGWLVVAAVFPMVSLVAFLVLYSFLRRFRVHKEEAVARLESVLADPERMHGQWKDRADIDDWSHQDLAQLSTGFRTSILALTPEGHEYQKGSRLGTE